MLLCSVRIESQYLEPNSAVLRSHCVRVPIVATARTLAAQCECSITLAG